MRFPWFKSRQYKNKHRDVQESRLNTPHWHYALTPTAVEGKLVWFEPYLRDLNGRGAFGSSQFRRRLSDSVDKPSTWPTNIKQVLVQSSRFYTDAHQREVFVMWPKTCEFTGRLLCMQKCVAFEKGHEYGVVDRRYVDTIALSTARLDGTYDGTLAGENDDD